MSPRHQIISESMLARARYRHLFLSTRICLEKARIVLASRSSMLEAISPWRHACHLVETPTEVALVGESSRQGDVNER